MRRSDGIIGLIIGLIIGAFLIPTLYNTGLLERLPSPYPLLLVALPLTSAFGLMAARLFERRIPIIWQVLKFGQIGIMNTVLDLGIFNALIFATGFDRGTPLVVINLAAFSFAMINSFLWNKYWVFNDRVGSQAKELANFIMVSLIAVAISSVIIWFFTTYISPPGGLTSEQWANAAKSLAIITSFTTNFLGYKFLVFKKSA